MNLDEILSRLTDKKKISNDTYQARCPAHDDKKASLSITYKNEKILLYCHAGCEYSEIMAALGFTKNNPQEIVFYDYEDLHGNLIFQSVKFLNPKDFRQRRPDGRGGWIWNLEGVNLTLFNLKNANDAIINKKTIFIVEGEKDAQTLINNGFVATTNPMGAGKWKESYSDLLLNANIVIIPDNDIPGHKHAAIVAKSLKNKVNTLRITELNLGELGNKKDVTDWFQEGGNAEKLKEIVSNTKLLKDLEEEEDEDLQLENSNAFRLTELGNAERFHAEHNSYLKFNYSLNKWIFWNGKNWSEDVDGLSSRFAKQTVRNIYAEAAEIEDQYIRKITTRHAILSESNSKIQSMINLAKSFPGIASTSQAFDLFDHLFNMDNGILDLEKMEFLNHDKNYQITKRSKVSYDETQQCPQWIQFLNTIFDSSQELITFVQKAVGLSLSGYTDEQFLFFAYGTGANGKSTFFETLRLIFGDYFQKSPTEMLLMKNSDGGINNDVARLIGTRFVVTAELPSGKRINEQMIKDLTGGDVVTARFLHKEFFEFKPTHKLWIYGNHKPKIIDTDEGIWRRLTLIPFDVKIEEKDQIPQRIIIENFKNELSGIFNWIFDGWKKYKSEGFGRPEIVKHATSNYKSESDVLGIFLIENCELDPKHKVLFKKFYEKYITWASDSKEFILKKREFLRNIEERGFGKFYGNQNNLFVRGVNLKDENQSENKTENKKRDIFD